MPYLIQPGQAQLSQLPVTGQTVSYETGDDGYYQSGFDPATRFEEAVLAGVTVVIDHATSLMWPKTLSTFHSYSQKNWFGAIADCEGTQFAGFTDWRLPNIKEVMSIIDYALGRAHSIFTGPYLDVYLWTGTTNKNDTTKALALSLQGLYITSFSKTTTNQFFCGVRNL